MRKIARAITLLSLSPCLFSCNKVAQFETARPTASQKQMPSIKVLEQSMGKLNNELGTESMPIYAPSNSVSPQSGKPAFDPRMIGAFADLAKLYSQRGERQPLGNTPAQSDQEKLAYLKQFFADQSTATMIFAYQLQGNYKEAAEILAQHIHALESANSDGRNSHSLALSYGQYADYLNHLGRSVEAQNMLAKARAIEPNHY